MLITKRLTKKIILITQDLEQLFSFDVKNLNITHYFDNKNKYLPVKHNLQNDLVKVA